MKKYNMPETELVELYGENPMCLDNVSGGHDADYGDGGDAPARIGSLGPGY